MKKKTLSSVAGSATNSKDKFTPGPWVADDGEGYSIWSIWAKGRKLIANVIGDSAETDANASLIAAAPDLLEAAKDAQRILSKLADRPNYAVTVEMVVSDYLGKAIAKAEGGQ